MGATTMQRWTGFGESPPDDLAELIAAQDARDAAYDAAPAADLFHRIPASYRLPLALGALALGALFLFPEGGSRRR